MKSLRVALTAVLFVVLSFVPAMSVTPAAGFFLPDSVRQMTLKYQSVEGLVVLPFTINDSIKVNLILDTGCRNLVLFGKKFSKHFRMSDRKPVIFSGLGDGRPVTGHLSIGNTVSINAVLGEQIPVVIVDDNKFFGKYHHVDGVIGYDIFLKFEIELNAAAETITFREALTSRPPPGFSTVPLRIVDARPVMQSQVLMTNTPNDLELMIDTGSSLGLLLKTTNIKRFAGHDGEKVLGIGLNGPLSGYKTMTRKVVLQGMEFSEVPTGIVASPWHNNASIGMKVLKDYVVILNYCQAYAGFKAQRS